MGRGPSKLKARVELELGNNQGEDLKTAGMFRLERKFNRNIYDLLAVKAGSGRVLARRYGVSTGGISRWRRRLGIKDIPNPGRFGVRE